MIEQLITSFIAAAGFAIIFNVPKNVLVQCGIVGMIGWMVYTAMSVNQIDEVVATLAASFLVAVTSQVFAKWFRTPIIIFNISGIIPLVPGGLVYDAMRHFVENNYDVALQFAARGILISGAIALGLVSAEIINQMIRNVKWHKTYTREKRRV